MTHVERYLNGICPERAGFFDCDLPVCHDGPHRYPTLEILPLRGEKLDCNPHGHGMRGPSPKPVTMAEIDEKRGQASGLIERIRDMKRSTSPLWGSLLHESQRMLGVLRDEIETALVQWAKQGFKEVGAPEDDRFCGCGLHPHIQGHATLCYNTGDAVRDLHKVMDIADTNSRRRVFMGWKRNYIKECHSTYDIGSDVLLYSKGGVVEASEKACAVGLGKQVSSVANIATRGPFIGEQFGARIEASVLVLTNKKVSS